MKFKSFLRLIRVPNLPTTAADVAGGYFVLAGAAWLERPDWPQFAAVCAGSALIYSGGMADNDVRHAGKDHALGKPRPIVLGEVPWARARFLANLMLLGGVCIASFAGAPVLTLAAAIALGAMTYNRLAAGRTVDMSHRPSAPPARVAGVLILAACRALNVGLGLWLGALANAPRPDPSNMTLADSMAALNEFTRPLPWVIAGTSFTYFACLTAVSLFEDRAQDARGRRAVAMLTSLMLLAAWAGPGLIVLRTLPAELAHANSREAWQEVWQVQAMTTLPAFLMLAALSALIQTQLRKALADPRPQVIGQIIRWGIAGDCLLMGAFIALRGQTQLAPALAVASLFLLCVLLGRVSHAT